ncbi:tyrosine recombinase XerS [Pseudobacillus wudalianchiensis]|uniref:Tyrosine recombinase XerS n=1 Tax=Pseudobacillus wudalianchiensis TaxID=1743143 RepID=A0A1B9B2C5_9BACI|nr:tyrosine recombinase XerS [Bacillus wudalianchiensis]OCA90294.1 tyrosine recombinase XerS [Bacillus wudalianchiensis]
MAISRQHQLHEQRLHKMVKSMPFYVEEFIDDKLDHRSPSTLLNYLHDYKLFFEWLIAEGIVDCQKIKDIPLYALENLKLEAAQSFFKYIQRREIAMSKTETKKLEKVSVNRKISALRSLFHYLTAQTEKEDGEPYFYRNVMQKIEVHKVKETLGARANKIPAKILHDDDVFLLDYVNNQYIHELPENSRQRTYFLRDKEQDLSILSLFLGSGIRVNELVNLRLRDLDFRENLIHVVRKGGKKDIVAVIPQSMEDLHHYLSIRKERYNASDDDNSYIFLVKRQGNGQPLSVRAVQLLVKKYTKAFTKNKSLAPHKLCHTYATKLMEETNDIHLLMRQLGHTSTTTAALYSNPEQEKAKQAARLLGNRREHGMD